MTWELVPTVLKSVYVLFGMAIALSGVLVTVILALLFTSKDDESEFGTNFAAVHALAIAALEAEGITDPTVAQIAAKCQELAEATSR